MSIAATNQACPICGCQEIGERFRVVLGNGDMASVLACKACKHGWRLAQLGRDDLEQLYNEDLYLAVPPRSNMRNKILARQVRLACGKKATRILDIGCGNGTFLFNLDDGWSKHGVELDKARADLAQRYANAHVYSRFIEDCEYEPESFDCVTMFAVIEHLPCPDIVKTVSRILKPGGVFMLMTGDRTSRRARRFGEKWLLYRSTDHLHYYSSHSLDLILQRAEFQIEKRWWRWSFGDPLRPAKSVLVKKVARAWHLAVYAACEICPGVLTRPWGDHLYILCRKKTN